MRFDILSSSQELGGNRLLEASAGTGKTFAIENYVVRLLLETDLTIDQFLVVTFTKAAANDLKIRIRSTLESTSRVLKAGIESGGADYLHAVFDKGVEAVRQARQKIRLALFSFETASIYTLHAFCQKVLAEQGVLDPEKGLMKKSDIRRCIVDFMRTGMDAAWMHPEELARVWKNNSEDTVKVVDAIAEHISKGTEIVELPTFTASAERFVQVVDSWRSIYSFQKDKLTEDLVQLAQGYKAFVRGQKCLRDEFLLPAERFFHLLETGVDKEDFTTLIRDGLAWIYCRSEKAKKEIKNTEIVLNYPGLDERIKEELEPLVAPHHEENFIILRLAGGAQRLMRRYMFEERRFTYDEMIRRMGDAVEDEKLSEELRNKYQAAIVDEFQDTDPTQWRILRSVFLNPQHPWKGRLILVGDPKQSIYAFRQADIYTYLDAKDALGEEAFASLDTNFRSHPRLVSALNKLFDTKKLPDLITLPQKGVSIDCPAVRAGASEEKLGLLHSQEIGIQWVVSEDAGKDYPEYVAREILRLHQEYQVPFNEFAILTKDRRQGRNMADYLENYGIPCRAQHSRSLIASSAFSALKELLTAVLYNKDIKLIKIALGGSILGWGYKEVLRLEDPLILQKALEQFADWHAILKNEGFAACFQHILDVSGYGEKILLKHDGEEFFADLMQIGELLLEMHGPHRLSPEELMDIFDSFEEMESNEDSSVSALKSSDRKAVSITTIHSSKGLEYGVVFALGVADNTPQPDPILVRHFTDRRLIIPVREDSEDYVNHCLEGDAEKMRQFYVAATRAKYKLYLFAKVLKNPTKLGKASQMELYLRRSLGDEQNMESIRRYVELLDGGEGVVHCKSAQDAPSQSAIPFNDSLEVSLKFPELPTISFAPLYISSYTSLSPHNVANTFLNAPREFSCPEMTAHTLPAGAETGIILHALLEKIDFTSQVDRSAVVKSIEPYLAHHALFPWREVLADIVFSALSTPLLGFSLNGIKERDCYKEAEFLFAGTSSELLKGFVDLIFRHEGKYYFLDWKSNWLGPDDSYYSPEHLRSAMEANHYFLQAGIYISALERYLKLVDPRPFEECFGGYFYLFLRGLPAGKGVYYSDGR